MADEISVVPGLLQRKLAAGQFVVTAELAPPRSASAEAVLEKARQLQGVVDAVNVTDNTAAAVSMSALAAAVLAMECGLEPVVQLACRDRNRMALQSDLLGLAALGVRNVLLLSGDPLRQQDVPQPDLSTEQVIAMARDMRDQGIFLGGEPIRGLRPDLFLGAVVNPLRDPQRELDRLAAKVEAGCQFIQTQFVYDLDGFRDFMAQAGQRGLVQQTHILAGVGLLRSASLGRRLRETVPGVVIPDPILGRLESAPDPEQEGMQLSLELVEAIRQIPGVAGVHLMAVGWEGAVSELVRRAGLPVGIVGSA